MGRLPEFHGRSHTIHASSQIRRVENRALHELIASIDDDRWDFYAKRRPWSERAALEALYDGCIRQVDATLESIISALKRRETYRDTLIVITSDHGEGFGERSKVRDGFRTSNQRMGVHEVLLHVPLLVKPPANCPDSGGMTVKDLASLTQFPGAVKAEIEGEPVAERFVRDEVFAGANYDDAVRFYTEEYESIQPYLDEICIDQFTGVVQIIYRQTTSMVRKYVRWGDDEATIDIYDLDNTAKICSRVDDRVVAKLTENEPVDITSPASEDSRRTCKRFCRLLAKKKNPPPPP